MTPIPLLLLDVVRFATNGIDKLKGRHGWNDSSVLYKANENNARHNPLHSTEI